MLEPDADTELDTYMAANGLDHSTGVVEDECGTVAYVANATTRQLVAWTGLEWEPLGSVDDLLTGQARIVADLWVGDVTGDQHADILASWEPDGEMRAFGALITANQEDCGWGWATLIDSCGDHHVYDGLAVTAAGNLTGSGFAGECAGRGDVRFEPTAVDGHLLARPEPAGTPTCRTYSERIDLPILVCHEGWPIQMAQEALVSAGFDVDTDGYFGGGTQTAVIAFQHANNLAVHGVIDGVTWTHMYPPDDEHPDFDGDGVASPREIGHFTGATEYIGAGDYSRPAKARPPTAPHVVERHCEGRSMGIVGSMRGEFIVYRLIEVMSDGTTRLARVRSSWSNESVGC